MIGTLEQATTAFLVADSALSGSAAVAIGALVVVLAIVLVFVMVLRSNGGPRKTASGLGYDAQLGPRGQPQGEANGPWQRQGAQQPWQQGGDFGMGGPGGPGGPPVPGRGGAGAGGGWGQTQDYPGGMGGQPAGGQGAWGAPQSQGGWGEPAPRVGAGPVGSGAAGGGWGAPAAPDAGEQWPPQRGGWNAPPAAVGGVGGMGAGQSQGQGQQSQGQQGQSQGFDQAQGGWDMPAQAQTPGARGGYGPADAPAPPAAPAWDQPNDNNAGWGSPSSQPQHEWGQPVGGPPAPSAANAAGWGAPAAGGPAAGGFEGFGELDKTRVVRPGGAQAAQAAQAAQHPGMIVVRQGKEPGRIFEMRKDRLTIGRSRESDIFLEDLAVSRLHTTINREPDGRYVLRDENSANGTYVNSQKVSEHVLEEGDEIQVGQTVLAFARR